MYTCYAKESVFAAVLSWLYDVKCFFCGQMCCFLMWRLEVAKELLVLIEGGSAGIHLMQRNLFMKLFWVAWLSWCFFFMVPIHVVHGEDLVLKWWCQSFNGLSGHLLLERLQSSDTAPVDCWKVRVVGGQWQVQMWCVRYVGPRNPNIYKTLEGHV